MRRSPRKASEKSEYTKAQMEEENKQKEGQKQKHVSCLSPSVYTEPKLPPAAAGNGDGATAVHAHTHMASKTRANNNNNNNR